MPAYIEISPRPAEKRRGRDRHALPVAASSHEVFVCRSLNGLRLSRSSCAKTHTKEAANGSSVTPCRACRVGRAHANGKVPLAWADGSPIELRTIDFPGR